MENTNTNRIYDDLKSPRFSFLIKKKDERGRKGKENKAM
jgi:hypothetical protein